MNKTSGWLDQMSDEQIQAWFALEGWELRQMPDSRRPTFVNPGADLWLGHATHKRRPIAEHPRDILAAPQGEWVRLNKDYLAAAIRVIMGDKS